MRIQRILLGAALAVASWSAQAEDIGVGLIVPLSAPGDATGGQLIRRGAELGVEAINAQGGVLGKKLQLFVQDSQGKPEAGVAAAWQVVRFAPRAGAHGALAWHGPAREVSGFRPV